MNDSKLSLWKAHLEHWGGTLIPFTLARLPTRGLCCQSGCKTRIFCEGSLPGSSRRTGNFKFLRQSYGAPRFLFFRLLGEERILLGSGGPRTSEVTDTYSTRPSSSTCEKRTPGLDAVWFPEVPP